MSARKSTRKSALTQAQKDAALLRREKMGKLLKEVAKMTPEQKLALFRDHPVMTPEGRALSCFNTCFVIFQMKEATVVGGFQQWRRMGRVVKKGEKGLSIWFPRVASKAAREEAEAREAGREDGEMSGRDGDEQRFMMGTVFDISQTQEVETEMGMEGEAK